MINLIKVYLNRSPRLKMGLKRLLSRAYPGGGVSSHYTQLGGNEIEIESSRLRSAWQDDTVPARQRALVEKQLQAYRNGDQVMVFDVLVQALRSLPSAVRGKSVLEVGCSSGYYSEVFEVAGLGVQYAGCDYSASFVNLAQKQYPALHFDVEDAAALRYAADSFDVVISGCCLLHIPEYPAAIAETARVARQYAIFHRTPVVLGQPSIYYRKRAYGVETVEIHFNEPELLRLMAMNGLELLVTYTLDETVHRGVGAANRTYVCKKISK